MTKNDPGNRSQVYGSMSELPKTKLRESPNSPNSWTDNPGDSKRTLKGKNESVIQECKSRGVDGVDYKNNNPDFRPFTSHDFDGRNVNCEVAVPYMKGDRSYSSKSGQGLVREKGAMKDYVTEGQQPGNAYDKSGVQRSTNPLHMSDLSNYEQGDVCLAEHLSEEIGRNVTPGEVETFRNENNLTWHECADGKTMQLIPRSINDGFKHDGGTSLSRRHNQGENEVFKPAEDQKISEDESEDQEQGQGEDADLGEKDQQEQGQESGNQQQTSEPSQSSGAEPAQSSSSSSQSQGQSM